MNMHKLTRHFFRGISTTTLLAVGALSAHAHPGHNLLESTPSHVLSSPYHVAVLALSGVALFLAARLVQRQLPRRVLQVAGVVALAGAAILLTNHI